MNTVLPSALVKRSLFADAAVGAAIALLLLAATDRLIAALELPRLLLVGTAEFMLVYAAALLLMATRERLWSSAVKVIVWGNLLWSAAGLGLLIAGALSSDALGTVFVLVQSVAVGLLSGMECVGLRRSAPAASPSSPPNVLTHMSST